MIRNVPCSSLVMALGLLLASACSDNDPERECLSPIPVIDAGLAFEIAENSAVDTVVGSLSATGLGTSRPFWQIRYGNIGNAFEIDPVSGELSVRDDLALDFEARQLFTLGVRVSVDGCVSATRDVDIEVTNVDDAPTIDAGQVFEVSEVAANAAFIGVVTATATATNPALAVVLQDWRITEGNQAGIFELDADSGVLRVADNSSLDHENIDLHRLTVTVSDGSLTSRPGEIDIDVENVNDNSPIVDAGLEFRLSEGVADNTVINRVTATDPDHPVSYFNFAYAFGDLPPDPSNTLVTGVYTGGNPSIYRPWSVATGIGGGRLAVGLNINDPPAFDNWQIVSGNDDGLFGIDPQSGILRVLDGSLLSFDTLPLHNLGVSVSDGLFTSTVETVRVALSPVPVGPTGAESDRLPMAAIEHVIHVSVDGLHPAAIETLGAARLPAFYRMQQQGSFTHNARSDGDLSYTLPNHMSQLTGRPALGAGGHRWWFPLDLVDFEVSMHDLNGSYVSGVFDVVHDYGLSTAFYASKEKFRLFADAWDADSGALDAVMPDSGRNKIDRYLFDSDTAQLVDAMLDELATEGYHYTFLHLKNPDSAGHDFNWSLTPGSAYLRAVEAVDTQLARILDFIDGHPDFVDTSVLLVTADHGGEFGEDEHELDRASGEVDSGVVPFYLYGRSIPAGEDLYSWNPATIVDPGVTHPFNDDPQQPLRNGNAANFLLRLLGLPDVPGSGIDNFDNPYL